MKKTSLTYCLAITSLLITATTIPPTSAATKAKASKPQMAGRTAVAPNNTILNGVSAPKSSLGIDGDFYIDTKAMNLYGPKVNGRWLSAISLRGPQGQTGATGSSGNNGKTGANVLAAGPQGSPGSSGAKGEMGAPGSTGPAGSKGETGPVGSTGPAGAVGGMGANGAQGPAGANGSNGAQGFSGPQGVQGTTGATGATGPAGAQGTQGNAGTTGPAGAAGSPGATGSSNAYVIPIASWTLSTNSAGTASDSLAFGTLLAGKSYKISIIVHGVQPTAGSFFGAELRLTSLDSSTLYDSAVIDSKAFVSSASIHRYTFMIEGTVVVGATDTSLIVRVIDGTGATGGLESMTLSGRAFVQLVGQVN